MTDSTASPGTNSPPPQPGPVRQLLALWFGLTSPVYRKQYIVSGLILAVFKYIVEYASIRLLNGQHLHVLEFLLPTLSTREVYITDTEWFGWVWFLWTLPFVWIAASMSVRRCSTAGMPPPFGLLIFVPGLNLLAIVVLASVPDRQEPTEAAGIRDEAIASINATSVALGAIAGIGVALLSLATTVFAFGDYGGALFLGTPVLVGAIATTIVSVRMGRPTSPTQSVSIGMTAVALSGCVLLLFALEGVICLLMASPIALPLGAIGGCIGSMIASQMRRPVRGTMAAVVLIPGWASYEKAVVPDREFLVSTSIIVDAEPAQVWQHVISFPDLPEPDQWYYRYGIACPMRAEMYGSGVGAVRHCIFTTGTFVEPVTAWEEPNRLAFDVAEQPHPMFELTPYKHIHPPHLDGTLRSKRGEFVLEEMPDGTTRLTGNTWYTLEMSPTNYWQLWSDMIIHRIHYRVLDHVRTSTEQTRE